MVWKVSTNGDITTRTGDTGTLTLTGLLFDTAKLEIKQPNRTRVALISATPNEQGKAVFNFTKTIMNQLTVPTNSKKAIYIFDVTGYSNSSNNVDTIILGQKGIEDLNTITVYPKGAAEE